MHINEILMASYQLENIIPTVSWRQHLSSIELHIRETKHNHVCQGAMLYVCDFQSTILYTKDMKTAARRPYLAREYFS
jgi:hypothetical protein